MFKMSSKSIAAAAALCAGATLLAGPATANEDKGGRIEIGYLKCEMTTSKNNIVVSSQEFVCTMDSAEKGRPDEKYTGKTSQIGLDLSSKSSETLAWAVFAPAETYEIGRLQGSYGGVSADVALGYGAGTKILVGGFDKSIALQPISLTGSKGIGLSLGVESLELTYVPQ